MLPSPINLITLLITLPLSTSIPHPASLSPAASHNPAHRFHRRDNCAVPPPFSAAPNPCDCTRTSFSRWSWALTDLYFHSSVIFSTPSHQIDGGWVSFSLSHPAVAGVVFDCSAYSEQLHDWFYGDTDYECVGREVPASITGYGGRGQVQVKGDWEGVAVARATAHFRFDRSSGRVDVNSSWICTEDPVYPIYFKAFGSGTVQLSCNETKYQDTNWTSGQIYSTNFVECAKTNLSITPSEISAAS